MITVFQLMIARTGKQPVDERRVPGVEVAADAAVIRNFHILRIWPFLPGTVIVSIIGAGLRQVSPPEIFTMNSWLDLPL